MHYIMGVYFSENNSNCERVFDIFFHVHCLGTREVKYFLVGSGAPRRRSMVNCMNSVLGMRGVCLY